MNSTVGPAATPTHDAPVVSQRNGPRKARRKWQLYSGLFIVLKRKITLPGKRVRELSNQVTAFRRTRPAATCPNLSPKPRRCLDSDCAKCYYHRVSGQRRAAVSHNNHASGLPTFCQSSRPPISFFGRKGVVPPSASLQRFLSPWRSIRPRAFLRQDGPIPILPARRAHGQSGNGHSGVIGPGWLDCSKACPAANHTYAPGGTR